MIDPVLGAGTVAKLADTAGNEAVKTTNKLLERALGPSFDVLGEYFAERMTDYVNRNRQRIAERALAKSPGPGVVHPRTAYKVMEQGSFADGPVMAEYFGGILASSKSESGQDDSGVVWAEVLGTMSALQIRAHFILYREWAALLHGRAVNLGNAQTRGHHALGCSFDELALLLDPDPVTTSASLEHAITGLLRVGLINQYAWEPAESRGRLVEFDDLPFDRSFTASLSVPGLELYGWAQGLGRINSDDFTRVALPFDTDPPFPRLTNVQLRSMIDAQARGRSSDQNGRAATRWGEAEEDVHRRQGDPGW